MPPTNPSASLPSRAGAPSQGGRSRRSFLLALFGSWSAVAWTTFVASLGGMMLGTIRFLFPNVLAESASKFKAGRPEEYEEGLVNVRFKDRGTWIVRYQGIIYALSTTCTHLGCIPNWLEREQKFKCPCHGSGFRITGVNFEGPAPRPLERWAISIDEDGQIVVDKSRHFQKELGQWSDPDSFIRA
jgi:cytochrome b6-f complex iron-sulfur subunit